MAADADRDARRKASQRNLFLAATAACIGPLSFGFTIGYSSPALPGLKKDGILADESAAAWFASLINIGALLGGPIGGLLVEKIGRKRTVLVTNVPFFCGWLCICLCSGSAWPLYVGRLLSGCAVAMILISSPVYIAEVSTRSVRGMLGSCVQLAITIGIFLAYLLGASADWRQLAAFGAALPVLGVVAMLGAPETPRWLVMNGRKREAQAALNWIRGTSDTDDELRDIDESLNPADRFAWSEFRRPELYQPLVVSVGLMVLQQLSGINAVMYFTHDIFTSAGFDRSASAPPVVLGAVQVAFTLLACALVDRAGRRRLLLAAGLGMAASLLAFSVYYYRLSRGASEPTLAVLCLGVYIAAFSVGWGPLPTLIMSEIFPVRARGAASSLAVGSSCLFAFFVTKTFLPLQEAIGSAATFGVFGAFCVVGLFFVARFVPETKGRTLEDIELFFLGRGARKDGFSRLPSAL